MEKWDCCLSIVICYIEVHFKAGLTTFVPCQVKTLEKNLLLFEKQIFCLQHQVFEYEDKRICNIYIYTAIHPISVKYEK